jgi:hypothetical protein
MEIATTHDPADCDTTRPAIGTRLLATFVGGEWSDTEVAVGRVTAHYPDGLDVTVDAKTLSHDVGDVFTVFDSELAAGKTLLEVLA